MAERRESVRLELIDGGFSTKMAKNAVATGLLERALKSLDGTTVNIHQSISDGAVSMDRLAASSRDADGSINQLTGRLRVLAEVAAVLGPSLTPIGGVGIAGLGGLANQMGFAAVAGGVLIGSLQGVGDALGAMNDAANDPSDANLEKAAEALERLSPAARDFAEAAFDLKPALLAIRDMGAESLIPGLTASLNDLERLGPQVGAIFEAVGGALGDIAADGAASLASDRWRGFFEFIEAEGPRVISELATTVGDLTHGLSELWQAFAPLNNDFSSWLMGVADGFDSWATGLAQTEGFQNFIDYIRETGPQVADTLGALGDAVVQIVQATAPLGGPVLAGIEATANAIAAIADSDLGTPILAGVAALSLLNRTLAVTASLSKVSLSSGLFAGLGTASKGIKGQTGSIRADIAALSDTMVAFGANTEKAGVAAARMKQRLAAGAGLAGLAVAATGAADGIGLTNTASLALMGSFAGPVGVAIGAGVGAFLDLKSAGEGATAAIDGLAATAEAGNIEALKEQLEAAKKELADINNLDFGGDILDRIGFQVADTFGGTSADEAQKQIEAAEQAVEDLTKAQQLQELQSRASAIAYASQAGVWMTSAEWARKSTEEIEAQAKALQEVDKEADGVSESFLKFPASLNTAKVSLGDFIADMRETADAFENFNNNSLKAARKGLDEGLIRSLRKMGEEGALRMRQFANANKTEIEKANAAHRDYQRETERSRDVTRRLAGMSPVQMKLEADNAGAMRNIDALEARLRAIKDENVNIVVRQIGATTLGPRNEAADGATVPKTGKPYADRHLYLLADGEEVISNRYGQADRYRSLLKDINANRRLAEGGTTGDDGKRRKVRRGVSFYAPDNTAALQAAIDRLTGVAEDQTAAVENQTRRTDEWAQKMSDVAQATVAGFNTGLFSRDSSPWAAGAGGGALFNLTRDISGLQERGVLQQQLANMGLTGDALAALLEQGSNADITGLIQSGQVSQYAALFNQRAALQGSVGAAAGQQAYGAQFAAAERQTQVLESQLRQTNLELIGVRGDLARVEAAIARSAEQSGAEVGRAINNGAATAQRNRKNDTKRKSGVRRR